MKIQLPLLLILGFSVVSLNGCMSVGPDYETPDAHVSNAWKQALTNGLVSGEADLQAWWGVFNDDTLDALMVQAAIENLDLKTAAARVAQARALRGVAAGEYYPSMAGIGSATTTRTSEAATASGAGRNGEFYQTGISVGWELDLWGRIRRNVESANASLQASEETYRDLLVLLYSDVADTYISIRTLQQQIALAENNLAAQAETKKLTEDRFNSGLVPRLDVSQAELNYSSTAATLPALHQSLVQAMNRIEVLVGKLPSVLRDELVVSAPIPVAPVCVTVGLPADLLRQRPDVRQAERQLAAQHAKIGVAKADFFPTFTLPGTLVLEAANLGNGTTTAYNFGPQFRWNLFAGGRVLNNVRAEEAATQAALHIYEQTLLLAVEEAENLMASFAYEKDRNGILQSAVASAQESVEQVTELYTSGLIDFQNVLVLERDLLQQQNQQAASQGQVSRNLVQLYKALGGGWAVAETEDKPVAEGE